MRQNVRFHVRRLELEAIHVNAFEMIYPFDVTDLRGHSSFFFKILRARARVFLRFHYSRRLRRRDVFSRGVETASVCFVRVLRALFLRVLCVVRPFFCGYYELFFFPIPRQRERVRESERERDGAHTREHTHAQRQRK